MADLIFNIEGNNEDFIKKAEQICASIRSITIESEKASSASSGFEKVMKKAFNAIGGQEALKQFVSDVVRVRGEYQQLEQSFGTLLQSKEKADGLMSQMMKAATETPYNLTELGTGAKQLLGYGVASDEVNNTLLQLGDIASGVGVPLEQLTTVYGKVMTQGTLYTDDLNSFSTSGVPMLQGLADMMGMSASKIDEMVAAGKIGFPEVQGVIENLTTVGGLFYGSMDQNSATIAGSIDNLHDTWEMMLNDIGTSQESVIGGAISSATFLVEHYEQIGKTILTLIEIYGVYKAACIANIVFTQTMATTQMELGLVMAKLQKAFVALTSTLNLNPWVLAATAIIGLGLAMWNFAEHTTAAEQAQKRFNEGQEKFNQQQQQRKQKVESLIHVIQDETETEYAKADAYEELQKYSPALTKAYTLEKIAHLDLAESQKVLNKERDETQYEHITTKIKTLTESLKRLKAENGKVLGTSSVGTAVTVNNNNAIQLNEEELRNYNKQLAEYNRLKKEAEERNLPIEQRIVMAEDNLDKIQEEFNKVNTFMIAERAKADANSYYVIPLRLELDFAYWGKLLKEAKAKLFGLQEEAGGKTYQEVLGEAKEAWVKSKKNYLTLANSKTSTPEAVDDAKTKMKLAEQTYRDLGGIDRDREYEDRHKKFLEQQKRMKELQDKQKIDEKQAAKDLKDKLAQSEIDAMAEGSDKTLAQMKLNHQKEKDAIKKLQEDSLQKKIDSEKAIYDTNPDTKKGTFDPSKISLDPKEEQKYSTMSKYADDKYKNELSVYYKDVLSQYQGYTEQRLVVEEKFQKDQEALKKAGASKEALAELEYQKNESLKSVDNQFAMREDSFNAWANSIANSSLETLQKLLFQAEQELQRSEFLNPNDPNLAVQRAKVSSLKEEISTKSNETQTSPDQRSVEEWQDLYQTLGKVEKGFEEIGEAVGGTAGEIISAAGGIASSTLQMIDGIVMLANGSASAMSSTSKAASSSVQAVEKASVILAVVGAALQIVTKMASMFGADYSDYEQAKENYENYVEVLDVVIGKQKELLETLTGEAAVEASQEALGWISKQADAARNMGKERLESGASAGSRSIGVRMRRGMSSEGWHEVQDAVGMDTYNQIQDGRMTGLFDLSVEQLEKLQLEAPTFWAKLDGDVRDYLNQIIACNEQSEEMKNLLNESLTQVSFDNVFSSFLDSLSDMDASSEDFANNFEKYMQKAILNTMLVDKYKSKLSAWYTAFAKANDDKEGITTDEYQSLQNEWNTIVSEAIAERDTLMEKFNWTSEGGSSQSSDQKGFAAMSQDTGNELNGRFTALQISNEEIKNSMLLVLGSLSSLYTTASDGNILLTEMRNLSIMSNGHLEDIAKHTKVLLGFGEKLDNIDRNTQKI